MKQTLLNSFRFLAALLILCSSAVYAQNPPYYNIAVGTSTNAFPWSTSTGKGIQWLVDAGEFSLPSPAPGGQNITEIWFYAASAINATYTSFSVKLGQVSGLNDPAWTATNMYSGPMITVVNPSTRTINAPTGTWFSIPLDVQFLYNSAQALVVEVDQCSFTGTSTQSASTFSSTGVRRKYLNPTACVQGYSGQDALMSPIGLTLIPNGPCTVPPTAGHATISNAAPCFNTTPYVNLVGNSWGTGQTFQWEMATNINGPYTAVTAALNTPTTPITINTTGTQYYRAAVTCTAQTTYSDTLTVNVPLLFPAGTYTINNNLPTGGGNFTSFSDAVSAVSCGIGGPVIFNVAPGSGPYNEQVTLPATLNTSATNTLTFNGNNATLTSAGGSSYATLILNGSDYVTFKKLNIEATGATTGFGVQLTNSADNNTIDSCNVTVNSTGTVTTLAGIVMSGSPTSYSTGGINGNNNTISNCTVKGGYFGITFYGVTGSTNQGNNIINCSVQDYYAYGIYQVYMTGGTISGNNIERPLRTSTTTTYGVAASTGCISMTIKNNRIHNLFQGLPGSTAETYGVYCISTAASAGNENKVYNNLVYDINSYGNIFGVYLSSGTYAQVYHNTISLDDATSQGGTTYGIYSTGATAVDIKNNNVYITRGGPGIKYGLYYTGAKTSDYNNIYVFSPSSTAAYIGWHTNAPATGGMTLAAWQAVNSAAFDQHSQSMNPAFANAAAGDFTPQLGLLNDKGTSIATVTTDIMNASRNATTPDIGAYEFADPACTGAPTAGPITGMTVPLCATNPFGLAATGFTPNSTTFQWESSPVGAGTWTAISGATTPTYFTTSGIAASTDYHLVVTCTGSTTSTTSPTYTVNINGLLAAGTYTIDNNLPTGSGNFASFNDAVLAMKCGTTGPVVFNVASGSGPYNEQVTIPATIAGSATNTVTINGNGATLTSAGSFANYATLNLDGADYVTINNLVITASGTTNGFAVHLMNSADNNTFDGCTFNSSMTATGTTAACVSMSASTTSYSTGGMNGNNNTFKNSTTNGGYFGFAFYGASGNVNQNNKIENCNIRDYYIYGSYNLYQSGAIMRGNIVERTTRSAVSSGYGIVLTTGCTNVLVEKNWIRKLFDASPGSTSIAYCLYDAVSATAGNENKFYNNIVSDINSNGTIYGMYLSSASYVRAYNNTISLDDATATGTTTTYGIYATGTASVDIRDNIVSIKRGGGGTKQCVYYSSTTAVTSNYNDLYIASAAGTNYIGSLSGTGSTTLAAWQAVNSNAWDQNSVSLDPVFTNPSGGNYIPSFGLVDDKGTPLAAITTDYTGAARNASTPDMGAFEFAVPSCTGAPTAGTLTGPTTVCAGSNILLSLSGFSLSGNTSFDWQSSPAGVGIWTTIATNQTSFSATQTLATDYRVVVTCLNGGQTDISNVVTVAASPFYLCYCSPNTGTTLHSTFSNYILNVAITNTPLSVPTSGIDAAGGYNQHNFLVPTNTGTLVPTVPYTIDVILNPGTANAAVWIDYDQSGTFDALEYTQLTTTNGIASGTINVPASALPGLTGMRVRAYTTTAYTSAQACASITTGYETEDFVVTIDGVPTCMPPTTITAGNMTPTAADVSWGAVTGAAGYNWAVDQTPSQAPDPASTVNNTTATAPATLTGLSGGHWYYLHVQTDCGTGTSPWMAYAFAPPPANDTCTAPVTLVSGTPVTGTTIGATQTMATSSCATTTLYANDAWYTFTIPTNSDVVLTATNTSGDVVMTTHSGSCGSFTQLDCQDSPAIGTETSTLNNLAAGTYAVRVYGFLGIQTNFVLTMNATPLAIDLTGISATNYGSRNRVDWSTGSELKSDVMELERSIDGRNFAKLTSINAKGQPSNYSYWDESPATGVNHYRVKMTDVAGRSEYSKVVTATVKSGMFNVEAYPNPVSDKLTVIAYGTDATNATVTISDVTGKIVKIVVVNKGMAIVDMKEMTSGVYLVKYQDSKHAQTVKVTRQ